MVEDLGNSSADQQEVYLPDRMCALNVAAERLSIVRYVFLVQIEDGIASAFQRAALEYADAVLMSWPDDDNKDLFTPDEVTLKTLHALVAEMQQQISKFSALERRNDVDAMTSTLVAVTRSVANIRSKYQPDFTLPTFEEIQHVVQDEWDEEIGMINPENAGIAMNLQEDIERSTSHTS